MRRCSRVSHSSRLGWRLPRLGSARPTIVNRTLFFSADDGRHGFELWKTDGTAAGTRFVKDIRRGHGGSNPSRLTNVNGTLFFSARDGTRGRELWRSDGTPRGTTLVADINGDGSSTPRELRNLNGSLQFTAEDGVHGRELWRTDPAIPSAA